MPRDLVPPPTPEMPEPKMPAGLRTRLRWWEIVLGMAAAAIIGEAIRSFLR